MVVNCADGERRVASADMADPALQQQLDEVRALLARARELFGTNPVEPPTDIAPDPDAIKTWLR